MPRETAKQRRARAAKHPWRLLRDWQAKARCAHSQRRANMIWRELNPYLLDPETHLLSISWSHARCREGPAELDYVCDAVYRRLGSARYMIEHWAAERAAGKAANG